MPLLPTATRPFPPCFLSDTSLKLAHKVEDLEDVRNIMGVLHEVRMGVYRGERRGQPVCCCLHRPDVALAPTISHTCDPFPAAPWSAAAL